MTEQELFRGFCALPLIPKNDDEKRQELIDKLHKIIKDLENGYVGFMYLYDELC